MLPLKDYYKILELPPSADPGEIKKAYRRLAMIYHPDKNHSDKYAALQFAAIKEAYETLANPVKKEEYLHQRWYAQSTGNFKPEELISPFSVLQKILYIERKLSFGDAYRLDHNGVEEELHYVLSAETINAINHFDEVVTNDEIIRASIACLRFLPFGKHYQIVKRLEQIQASLSMHQKLQHFIVKQRTASRWERSKYLLLIVLTIILCAIIFLFAE